jgi:hypothetical protein
MCCPVTDCPIMHVFKWPSQARGQSRKTNIAWHLHIRVFPATSIACLLSGEFQTVRSSGRFLAKDTPIVTYGTSTRRTETQATATSSCIRYCPRPHYTNLLWVLPSTDSQLQLWVLRWPLHKPISITTWPKSVDLAEVPCTSTLHICLLRGRDSSVCIATRYRLDSPGIESQWERYFPYPSKPALGPIQPPTQWVRGHSRGIKRQASGVNHPPTSSAKVKERVELYLYSPSGPV